MLPEEGRFHLSTLMVPENRERTLEVIRERLQKGKICRVVSTSLVEAGVDVDFPTVWREMTGLDSILQAAGRCNREGRRNAEQSIVHVFEMEGGIPRGIMQQREAAIKTMEKYPEINTRQAIQAYFKRLLMERGDDMLDQKKILNLERSCMFKQTEREFRLIDEDTRTVYIPNRENAADLARLRAGQYSKTLFRRLARSSVNIYQKEYLKLVSAAAVEDFDDFGLLIRQDQYNAQCGLSVDAEDGFLMI